MGAAARLSARRSLAGSVPLRAGPHRRSTRRLQDLLRHLTVAGTPPVTSLFAMDIRVLGPMEVEAGGSLVGLGGRRQRAVLAVLVASHPRPVTTERLIELVWDGHPPPTASSTLRSYISLLRRALDLGGSAGQRGGVLRTTAGGYVLDVPPEHIDAARFEQLGADGRRARRAGDHRRAANLLTQALKLWRGQAYQDFVGAGFAITEARRLEELGLDFTEELFDARLALAEHVDIVADIEAHCAEHPIRERAVELLMTALYRSGRQAEALRVYDNARHRLIEELGADPSPPLTDRYQAILEHRDPGESGPLPTPRRLLSNLPLPTTSLVGRDDDIADIARTFERARLVSLTGVGGVGKTRLAVAYGHHVVDAHRDGVWLCELAGAGSEFELVATIAQVIGVDRVADRPLRESLVDALVGQAALVILDNCEHVLDAVADLVAEALPRSPGLQLLATSREPLGVEGEHVRVVRSLLVPDDDSSSDTDASAIELFEQRARAVRPDFVVADGNRADVIELCRRLDGIPLAIELIAARVTAMNPRMLLKRLDGGTSLLRAAGRGRTDRHRTLHAAIAWSYDLLAPDDQWLFDRLSVFSGGFTLDAALAVCGEGAGVTGGVERLVDKSMVRATFGPTDVRYSLLETLRQFGEVRLAARGETDAVARAHALYYRELLYRSSWALGTRDELTWLPRLQAEIENGRDAAAWALATREPDLAAHVVGPACALLFVGADDLIDVAVAALDLPGVLDRPEGVGLLAMKGLRLLRDGDLPNATTVLEDAIERAAPDNELLIFTFSMLGTVRTLQGRGADARAAVAAGMDVCHRAGRDEVRDIWFVTPAVMTELVEGDVARAVDVAQRAVRHATERRSRMLEHRASYVLGEALTHVDPEAALGAYDRAVDLARRSHGSLDFVNPLLGAAALRARSGHHAGALASYHELIDHLRRTGNWIVQWTTLRNLVELLVALGQDEDAAVLLGACDTASSAPPVHGVHGERLAGVRSGLRERLGDAGWTEISGRGADLHDRAAGVFALDAVARAAETLRATAS